MTGVLTGTARQAAAWPPGDGASEMIAALREGSIGTDAAAAAERAGLNLGRPGSAAVLCHVGARQRAWLSALSWLGRPVHLEGPRAYTVVASADDLRRLRRQVLLSTGADTVVAACGSSVTHPADYLTSFLEADRLLQVARLQFRAEYCFDDAGMLQVLLTAPAGRLEWFVRRHLGPIEGRPEWLETLQAWLIAGGSRRLVSEQLHLHRNTVGYRVRQIRDRLGIDPLDPQTAAVLLAALSARELMRCPQPPLPEPGAS